MFFILWPLSTKNIPYPTGHSEKSSCSMKLVINKRSGTVVMSPDSGWLGAAVVVGVGSNLTQAQWYFIFLPVHFFFSEVLASVMILGRNSLLKCV